MSFKNDFLTRLIVALVAGAFCVGLAWYSDWSLLLVFAFFTIIALWEFFSMVERGGYKPYKIIGYGIALFFLAVAYHSSLETYNSIIVFSILGVFLLKAIQSRQSPYKKQLTMILISVFGAIYIGGSLSFAIGLRKMNEMKFQGLTPYDYLFLVPFAGAWASDTGAYLTGRLVGKDKLAPTISEKKTVEGLIGGVVASFCATYFFGKMLNLPLSLIVVLGISLPLLCTAGDLFESSIKRRFEVKDSGTLFKAHGGVLDRFDGIFFVLPLTYALIYYFYIYKS